MTERMKQAVRAYMDWLRMAPEDRGGLDECPVEDRLAPLGLSMRQHEKALRHALTKLMKKGYVIRMLDGWPQAIPLDDVPKDRREEIIRRRRDPSEDDIVARHGGVGIGFLSVSDEEAEKYYGPAPNKSERIYQKILGLMCATCGNHEPVSAHEMAEALQGLRPHCPRCGETDPARVSAYMICETPCSTPTCLCHTKTDERERRP